MENVDEFLALQRRLWVVAAVLLNRAVHLRSVHWMTTLVVRVVSADQVQESAVKARGEFVAKAPRSRGSVYLKTDVGKACEMMMEQAAGSDAMDLMRQQVVAALGIDLVQQVATDLEVDVTQ